VKKIMLAILLSLSAYTWAGTSANPADYSINVHVSQSRNKTGRSQRLKVVINGKNYELVAYNSLMLLALGDYKARLVKDQHSGSASEQVYEFLIPNEKPRKFRVIGETE
jgi:hypothetical protein